MKAETLDLILSGLDNLRDEVAMEVEEKDRDEKREVVTLFETIRPIAIAKAGAKVVASNNKHIR
jgi:hypothetical protein